MKFALDVRGTQWLRVDWQGRLFFRRGELRVYFGQVLLGSIPSDCDLKQGREFILPDATVLQVRLARNGLQVRKDGQDLIHIQRLRENFQYGWILLLLAGALDGLGGLACLLGFANINLGRAAGIGLVIFGGLFLGLAWWASRWVRSAFLVAIGLVILQALLFAGYVFKADPLVIAAAILLLIDFVTICLRAAQSVSAAGPLKAGGGSSNDSRAAP
jgi:hypothetical protein